MATKKGKRVEEQPRDLTRKEHRLRREDRERNRKLLLGTAVVLGLVVLVLAFGLISEFLLKPNSTVVQVGQDQIITRDYWKRLRYEENQLVNQYMQYNQLEQQFGGQGFFTAQIQQIQATLSSPFALGVDVLNRMIEERIIEQQAAERGITVSDAEVEEALREQVAATQGLVTEPQATSTAQAAADATATAAGFTPTPMPEVDASAAVTATEGMTATEGVTDAEAAPTPAPLPTRAIITDTAVQEGLATLESSLQESVGYSLADYRQIVRTGLLAEKLQEVIADEQVQATEEQVHARHILISEITPTPTVEGSAAVTATAGLTGTDAVTAVATPAAAADLTETVAPTAAEGLTEAESSVTATTAITEENTEAITGTELAATEAVTAAESLTATAGVTATETVTPSAAPERPAQRTKEEALALATELRQRILAGEDFATLAAQYSDDQSNAQNGGDLGWFNRNAMVAPFADVAFSLPVGEVSEPVETQFGYHLIEVLEKDEARPKPEDQLQQERAQAFSNWLQEQVTAANVQRPADLVSLLPKDIAQGVPLAQPAAPDIPIEAAPQEQ